MKLRVLLLAIILSFGILVSPFVVQKAQASIFEDAITNILEFISAQEEVEEDSSKTSLPTVNNAMWDSSQSKFVVSVFKDDTGAVASIGKSMAMMYQKPPASGETYVADLMHNMKIGPAQPAYAQVGGLGFAALEPVLYAWKQFRNIAYLFFIVITLIIGFMIMLRQKVGSQAAVTAQQAIPQIVIALITVTFSYAVAGFLIDMMYVLMYLFVGLFPDQSAEDAVAQNIFQIAGGLFSEGIGTAFDSVGNFVENMVGGGGGAEVLGIIAGLTFAVIIAFAYLFAMVQLFFELLKTYISIIVNIVLSPMLLMLGALPGRKDVFVDWIRSLVANLIAFPVVLLLVILHGLLTEGSSVDGGFLPPFLMGRGNSGAITSLTGLAIMLIAKDLVVQAKKAFNPKGSGIFEQFGSAISTAVSKGWKGGELIPGVGLTDTNKMPVVGKYLGSGQKVLQTGSSLFGTGVGAAGGTIRGIKRVAVNHDTRKQFGQSIAGGARTGGRLVSDAIGSSTFDKNRSERQKSSVFTDRSKFRKLSSKEGK